MQATGANSQLLIGVETTFGVDASTFYRMPFNTSEIVGSRNTTPPATITGNRNPVQPFDGNKKVGGQVVVPCDSVALWYWLQAAFNNPTITGSYDHEFLIPQTQPSLTIEQGFTDIAQYIKFNGCKINTFGLEVGGDGELTCSFDVIGSQFSDPSGTPVDATPTDITLERLNNFQAAIQEGGAPVSNIKTFSLNINMDLDDTQYVIGGGGILGFVPEGIPQISGSITALFEDAAYLTKAINSTESSLQLTITGPGNSILDITIPELKYSVASPAIKGPKGIDQTLNFSGYYKDNADSSAIKVILTNDEAH